MADFDHQYIASLVEYARSGDSDAFAELYLATCQRQYRFAYHYLKNEKLTQDVIRDTYIFALKNIAALKDADLFLPWLSQITLRTCLGTYQKQKMLLDGQKVYDYEELEQLPSENLDPEEDTIRVEGHDFVIRQVMNLPFTESQVIILRYYNRLKIREIAKLLDMRSGSVRRYLTSGCRKLMQLSNK